MSKYVETVIAGMSAELPVFTDENGRSHVVFSLSGRQELTEHCAKEIYPYIKGCDVIITSAGNGSELAHSLARLLKQPRYAVSLRSEQMYILDGIAISVRDKKSGRMQNLRVDSADAELIRGKKVAIVGATIGTGGALSAVETLVKRAGGEVFARAFVLRREDETLNRDDVFTLGILPVID